MSVTRYRIGAAIMIITAIAWLLVVVWAMREAAYERGLTDGKGMACEPSATGELKAGAGQ